MIFKRVHVKGDRLAHSEFAQILLGQRKIDVNRVEGLERDHHIPFFQVLPEIYLSDPGYPVEGRSQRFPGNQGVELIHRRLRLTKGRLGIVIVGLGNRVFLDEVLIPFQRHRSKIPLGFRLMELRFFLNRVQTNQQIAGLNLEPQG